VKNHRQFEKSTDSSPVAVLVASKKSYLVENSEKAENAEKAEKATRPTKVEPWCNNMHSHRYTHYFAKTE
jgi:hypothetical protein